MNKNNPNRQGFFNHLDTIKRTESDKDAFLKASRLERHESKKEPLSAADRLRMCGMISVGIVATAIVVIGSLSGYFIPAMIGAGIVGFFGLIITGMMCE